MGYSYISVLDTFYICVPLIDAQLLQDKKSIKNNTLLLI